MSPVVVLNELQPTKDGKTHSISFFFFYIFSVAGHQKCREKFPSQEYEQAFSLFLDVILMVFPLLVLTVTYSLIIRTLWKGIQTERALRSNGKFQLIRLSIKLSK